MLATSPHRTHPHPPLPSTDHLAAWLEWSSKALAWREDARDLQRYPSSEERRAIKRASEAAAARAQLHRDLELAGSGRLA
jgi:hypothetical protein